MSRVFLAAIFISANTASGAGFDCAKAASKVEISICTNSAISALDDELSRLYKQVVSAEGGKRHQKQQREWLKKRNLCSGPECIEKLYHSRIGELRTLVEQSGLHDTCTRKDGPVPFLICSNSTLRDLNQRLTVLIRELKPKVTPEESYILLKAERFFTWERNDCENSVSANSSDLENPMSDCVRVVLERQVAFLEKSAVTPSALRTGIAQFPKIDVDFLVKFKTELVGQSKDVMGWLELLDPPSKLIGLLHSENPELTIPVVFKRLSNRDVLFIKRNNPYSSHAGKVIKRNGEVVLFLDSLLGNPL